MSKILDFSVGGHQVYGPKWLFIFGEKELAIVPEFSGRAKDVQIDFYFSNTDGTCKTILQIMI